jgi:hypothetical protein
MWVVIIQAFAVLFPADSMMTFTAVKTADLFTFMQN